MRSVAGRRQADAPKGPWRARKRLLHLPRRVQRRGVLRKCAVTLAWTILAAVILLLSIIIPWRIQTLRTPGDSPPYERNVSDLATFFSPRSSKD